MFTAKLWTLKATRRLATGWFTVGVLFILAGCGGGSPLSGARLYPVTGKVLLADGKPLTKGKVIFIGTKTQITSSTPIDSDGGFAFKSSNSDGLPEGEYRVILEPEPSGEVSKGSRNARPKAAHLPFAAIYTDEEASPLKATVTSDESKNVFELKLDAKDDVSSSSPRGGR